MFTEESLKTINRIISDKTFTYNAPIADFSSDLIAEIDFKIKLVGIKSLISIGDYHDHILVEVTITDIKNKIGLLVLGIHNEILKTGEFRDKLFHFNHSLTNYITQIIRYFGVEYPRVIISKIVLDEKIAENSKDIRDKFITTNKLDESKMSRIAIRTVVRDIVNILKTHEDGNFYLPEDVRDSHIYSFMGESMEFSVELEIEHIDDTDGFFVNAEYSHEDDVIVVVIHYNPETLNSQLYQIIGELNEIIAHELEHNRQNYRGELSYEDEPEDPFEYYTQPHEIEAQVTGFKRLAKLTRQPFYVVANNWFKTHKELHNLDDNQTKEVIDILLKKYNGK